MAQDDIRIERIKIKDLIPFANQYIGQAGNNTMIPITRQRSVAHTFNPYADGEEVGLLVAYYGNELVGYFGIMPVMLKKGSTFEKIYWFSTWLVSTKLRGKSVGSLLMQEALGLKHDYMIVGSSPARRVCRKFGFKEFPPLVYFELDLTGMSRLNPFVWMFRLIRKMLHPLKIQIKINNHLTETFARMAGFVTKRMFYQLLEHSQPEKWTQISFKEVNQVREEVTEQKLNLPAESLYRGPKIVNWMLKYPWVVLPGQSETEHLDYYFSDARDLFKQIALEIFSPNGEEYKGYLVFSISTIRGKTVLKILDINLVDRDHLGSVLFLALKAAERYRVDTIELPEKVGALIKDGRLGKLLLRKKYRVTQCSPRDDYSPLAQVWQTMELNYCDGDMAFS